MSQLPYKDASLPIEQRVADLLSRMTLEEKVAQIYQIWVIPNVPESPAKVKDYIRKFGVGSRILAGSHLAGSAQERSAGVEEINSYQRVAIEESRLGIPILHGRDVIHGFRTMFPIPLGMAASWDPALVEEAFAIAAREAASCGVDWAFAPMLDIARDPRWGRIAEGSGEDPYLTSRMAVAAVRGFQGDDLTDPERVLACAKHYIGYGAAEGGRDYNTGEISDTTLRNIYLPPFKAAVDAGLGSVMSAFEDLNGEPASGSYYLLTQLLKQELGFEGFVVSDWASVQELVNHRVAEDERDAARQGFNAGVDMEMVTSTYATHMAELVESGAVTMERLDDACRRILTAKFKLGLFEQPYTQPGLAEEVLFTPTHQAAARKMAAESFGLLKNEDNLLPLPKSGRSIAVIGPMIHQRTALLGSWTLDGLSEETQTIDEAMRAAAPQAIARRTNDALTDEMVRAALAADLSVVFVGESNHSSGENNNVAAITLPPGQEELVEAVCALGKPVVVVVLAGRALDLSRVTRCATAVLYAWHPGSLGAAALADVLFGDTAPSGRLPVTLPRSTGQIPAHYNFKSTGRTFDGVGRGDSGPYPERNRYVDLAGSPLYPFGFGLTYTTFAYSDLHVTQAEVRAGESVEVRVTVINTGSQPGVEVAQMYLQDCVASITRPIRELKGFHRLALQPGESQQVRFTLDAAAMSFYGPDQKLHLEPGKFKVWAGSDCRAELETEFWVK